MSEQTSLANPKIPKSSLAVAGILLIIGLLAHFGNNALTNSLFGLSTTALFFVAMLVATITGVILGAGIETTLIRPLYDRPIYQIMVTLGLSFIGIETVRGIAGGDKAGLLQRQRTAAPFEPAVAQARPQLDIRAPGNRNVTDVAPAVGKLQVQPLALQIYAAMQPVRLARRTAQVCGDFQAAAERLGQAGKGGIEEGLLAAARGVVDRDGHGDALESLRKNWPGAELIEDLDRVASPVSDCDLPIWTRGHVTWVEEASRVKTEATDRFEDLVDRSLLG